MHVPHGFVAHSLLEESGECALNLGITHHPAPSTAKNDNSTMNEGILLSPIFLRSRGDAKQGVSLRDELSDVCERQAMLAIPSVTTTLGYLGHFGDRPFNYTFEPPDGQPWSNYRRDEREVQILDARFLKSHPQLDREGFSLWHAPTAVHNFEDADEVRNRYYPELVELACGATGAKHAYIFDHTVRSRVITGATVGFGRTANDPPSANGQVHNDYTETSGYRRMKLVLGEAFARVANSRFAILNLWRPIDAPIRELPLALCNARTISSDDLVDASVHYRERNGDIYLGMYSPRHQWFYYSAMGPAELLMFKQYDSQVCGVSRFTLHAAFLHPGAAVSSQARLSIEARCLVVYD